MSYEAINQIILEKSVIITQTILVGATFSGNLGPRDGSDWIVVIVRIISTDDTCYDVIQAHIWQYNFKDELMTLKILEMVNISSEDGPRTSRTKQ